MSSVKIRTCVCMYSVHNLSWKGVGLSYLSNHNTQLQLCIEDNRAKFLRTIGNFIIATLSSVYHIKNPF